MHEHTHPPTEVCVNTSIWKGRNGGNIAAPELQQFWKPGRHWEDLIPLGREAPWLGCDLLSDKSSLFHCFPWLLD